MIETLKDTTMQQQEKDAVIDYLEFGLVNLVNEFENHVDGDAVSSLYEHAYALLSDMNQTMQVAVDMSINEQNEAK